MANEIALTTAATAAKRLSVVQSIQQRTLNTAEATATGAAVRQDTATGNWTNSNGTSAGEARIWGVAINDSASGAVTVIRQGIVDGFDLSAMAYDAPVYLSDTDGRLSTVAGTTSVVVGRVVPGTAVTNGTANDKLLSIEL